MPGPENIPPDTLSRRVGLTEPTISELQAGAEYKPRYPLDPALPKALAMGNNNARDPPCYFLYL